jgi:hypothetical protein
MLRDLIYEEFQERADKEDQGRLGEERTNERPSFLNKKSSVDTELLTDGGEDDET